MACATRCPASPIICKAHWARRCRAWVPAYGRTDGLVQVAPALRGKPLLAPQQIDDVVAYLASLR